jgi:hypothetical protein
MTSLPKHLQGDGPCSNCGTVDNIVWFTESVFWNAVVRIEPRLTDNAEILCIPCFVIMADQRGYRCNWRLLPEWHWETKDEADQRRNQAAQVATRTAEAIAIAIKAERAAG